ncbi:hypothetical protein [Desulfotruncus arcticus]|nr:hypothetical protein [Desulfotruncus arcticus]
MQGKEMQKTGFCRFFNKIKSRLLLEELNIIKRIFKLLLQLGRNLPVIIKTFLIGQGIPVLNLAT